MATSSAKEEKPPPASPKNDNSTRAVRGASLLILLQVISRAITFIANQLLLRFLTAQLLGVATQLEVYYLSVIFFARESLRVAIQRQDTTTTTNKDASKKTPNHSAQAAINLGYLSILLGIPLSFILGYLYLTSLSTTTLTTTPFLIPSLYIYALASITELLSEPAFVLTQTRLQFSTRATAESTATFLRCTITLGTAILGSRLHRALGVLPFAVGQLSYGVGLLLVYTSHGHRLSKTEGFSLSPSRIPSGDFVLTYFYRPTLELASSMMAQSVVKHVLTQGDTFLVSILSTPTAQGVYALANNYGGLVARLLFQPIEESSRSYFSRLLTPGSPVSSTKQAARDLVALLRVYAILSLVIITLGPTAAPLLLSLVAGPKWASSGAGECLAAYMWYIPLLAVNGVAEAFVASVATEKEVHAQSAWMGAFSLGFAASGFVFLRMLEWGATGLVVANGMNMACRILWCGVFIRGYFGKKGVGIGLLEMLPKPLALGAGVVTAQAVRWVVGAGALAVGVKAVIVELVKIAGVAVPFVGILILSEKDFLLSGWQTLKGKREKTE
ncbi:hypothetical protein OQA88_9356 [Cercophora sp. LCS_1]